MKLSFSIFVCVWSIVKLQTFTLFMRCKQIEACISYCYKHMKLILLIKDSINNLCEIICGNTFFVCAHVSILDAKLLVNG